MLKEIQLQGFDVTEKQGTITILSNREITTTSTKSETLTFTFTFVNYDFNQAANAGGNFSARVLIKKNGAIMSDVCKSGDKLSDCIIAMYGIDDTLYYHDENLENGANDNSYRYSGGNQHPDCYSCSYNNIPVYNYETWNYNASLLGNCDTVYEVNYPNAYIDASFETYFYNEPVSISWDSENNVCLTADGYEVYTWNNLDINVPDFCAGVAYQWKDSIYYYTGIEKVGSGTETLYDSNNNLYTCEYNGIPVLDYDVYEYNSSAQGNCSTVYKISYQKKYVDKSYQNTITETVNVKWDSTNKVCKTVNEDTVYDWFNKEIFDSNFCSGTADYLDDGYYLGAVEVGAGKATLYEKAGGVNNYVCFGSNEETCPDDNLYRIIGVFGDQVKLIKWDYATSTLLGTDGDYYSSCSANSDYCTGTNKGTNTIANIGAYSWNSQNAYNSYVATNFYNVWSYSELNTINLNTNFLNNIGTEWSSKMATTTWKVGGNTYANVAAAPVATAYTNEYTSPAESTTETSKVALMYTSDYGFAASPRAWTTILYDYNYYNYHNWMYIGLDEWTMVRDSENPGYWSLYVDYNGNVNEHNTTHSLYAFAVRPVIYLKSSINYISGSGTKSEPIIIN